VSGSKKIIRSPKKELSGSKNILLEREGTKKGKRKEGRKEGRQRGRKAGRKEGRKEGMKLVESGYPAISM